MPNDQQDTPTRNPSSNVPTGPSEASSTPSSYHPPIPASPNSVTAATQLQKRSLSQSSHPNESPAKKQSKWSAAEDSLIIELRGRGMKWEDISSRLPGRSAISCRLHYQNYLERRSEWDEDRKNKLARLYERQDSFSKIEV
jgi:Myb-like DNA-binding domain